MRSRYYAILSILVFGILYSYTAVLVLLVLAFAWLNMKKPVRHLQQKWAKSVFIIMGKKCNILGFASTYGCREPFMH
jgi:hypothetical protein